jgi:hypothetical protein
MGKAKGSAQKTGSWSTCKDCGKLSHSSRKDARAFAKLRYPGANLSSYVCQSGEDYGVERWHIGHLPSIIARGVVSRIDAGTTLPRPATVRLNH